MRVQFRRAENLTHGVALLRTAVLISALLLGLAACAGTRLSDDGPVFYPSPPQRPRVQALTSYRGAEDIEGGQSWLTRFLVGDTSSRRRFRKPNGIAAFEGVIYVTDPGWDSVITIDLKKQEFDTIRDRGEGKLRVPVAIAIDREGNKFVADTGRNQVVQFNRKDVFVRAFGTSEQIKPTGVAVDSDDLYVVDRLGHRVLIMNRRSGEIESSFGSFGDGEGEFNIPTAISRDEDGNLYVTDVANFRIQEFDSEGNFILSFGFMGDGPGTFARPKGNSIDREGHLYTVDAAFENVQIWDTSNAHALMPFGGSSIELGGMYLPADVFVSYDLVPYFEDQVDSDFNLEYVILVTNNYGPNKVAVYGFVNPKDPERYPEQKLPEEEKAEEEEE